MNFIVIVSDTFRFDNLGCYGNIRPRFRAPAREVMTPHLDALAKVSTIFDNAYIGSFPTVPNRKDVFTGKHVFPFEGWSPLAPDAVTFVKQLSDSGYETMMVQDTPHTIRRGFNFDRDFDGFDFIRGQESDQLASWRAKQSIDPSLIRGEHNWVQHLANIESRQREQDTFCGQTFSKAVEWLEGKYSRDPKGNFLLYTDTFDPHEPWDAPKWYEDLYNPGYKGVCHRYAAQGLIEDKFTKAELDHIRAMYAAEVTLVDRWVGHMLETASRMGLMENTCVIFTADHGYCLSEHGWHGKNAQPLYEEVSHIPLLIHMPGQRKSRRVKALTQPCDLGPTILDLARVKRPKEFEGLSLKGVLKKGERFPRKYAFSRRCMNDNPGDAKMSVHGDGFALHFDPGIVRRNPDGPAWEMYDLKKDPLENKNVLTKNLARARRMYDAYVAWLGTVNPPEGFHIPPRP